MTRRARTVPAARAGEQGTTAVEYVLASTLIGVVLITIVTTFGEDLIGIFEMVRDMIFELIG